MPTHDPITRRFVTLGGQRVSCLWRDGGHEGATLVFIHGSGMSARYWSDQTRALADTARVLAVDLPGHGDSDDAPAPSLAHYADATAGVIDALGARPAIVVGHSLGGAVAVALAARRPADVCGLVLLSACARVPPVSPSAQWLWASLPTPLRRVDRAAASPAAHRLRATALTLEPDAPTCAGARACHTSDRPSRGHAVLTSPARYAVTLGATDVRTRWRALGLWHRPCDGAGAGGDDDGNGDGR